MIDFYFDFSSPFGYLASQKIEALAAKHGRTVKMPVEQARIRIDHHALSIAARCAASDAWDSRKSVFPNGCPDD